eukprot:COSAG06_NODE_13955_length_1202_cov_1.311877_2_plen_32_part_01
MRFPHLGVAHGSPAPEPANNVATKFDRFSTVF